MLITKEITIDYLRRGIPEPVEAVQCDANTRAVKVTLLNGGESWTPPAGAVASVAFKKPDGTAGWYDKLPDGSNACTVAGNTVTAIFAPQMLTVAGKIRAAVVFQDAKLNQLATFPFTVVAEKNPAAGSVISNDYYNYTTMADVNKAMDTFFAEAEASQAAFVERVEADQAAFLKTATEALDAVHKAATADAPAIVCQASGKLITVSDASDRLLQGLKLFGKTTQNGTPTPTSPAELVSVGRVGVYGKNLLDSSKFPNQTSNGVQFFYNKSTGGVNVKGTSTAYANSYFEITDVLGPGTYTISVSGAPKVYAYVRQYYANAESVTTHSNNNFTVDGTESKIDVFIQVNPNVTVETTAYIQIESGTTATAFEPYDGQTLTVSTPNGLPVSSGGDYTDENGQRWLCDELDFARGVHVQRVGRDTFNGSESTWALVNSGGCCRVNLSHKAVSTGYTDDQSKLILCNRLQALPRKTVTETNVDGIATMDGYLYLRVAGITDLAGVKAWVAANPITVVYIPSPAIAVETPLSAEELAAYAALHSNKPNTTAFNDAGAGMKLAYVADTKMYIDNKFGELAAALVNNN